MLWKKTAIQMLTRTILTIRNVWLTDNDSDETGAFHAIVTSNSKRDERPGNLDQNPLQSQCLSLTPEFLTLKKKFIGEINTVLEKLKTSKHPNNEHSLCQEQIKCLWEENNSKNLIIKILSENQNAFNGCLSQQSKSYEPYHDSNVPFIDLKKTVNIIKRKTYRTIFYHQIVFQLWILILIWW